MLRGLVDGTGLELGDGRRLLPGTAAKNDENDGVIRIHDQVCSIIIIILFVIVCLFHNYNYIVCNCLFCFFECFLMLLF